VTTNELLTPDARWRISTERRAGELIEDMTNGPKKPKSAFMSRKPNRKSSDYYPEGYKHSDQHDGCLAMGLLLADAGDIGVEHFELSTFCPCVTSTSKPSAVTSPSRPLTVFIVFSFVFTSISDPLGICPTRS
jgi:hypothetical protein